MANSNVILKKCKAEVVLFFFLQERGAFFKESFKCLLYKYLPDTFPLQFYLCKNIPENLVALYTKYKLSSHFREMRFWGILYGFPSTMAIELMFKEENLMLWIHDTIWDWLGRCGLTMFCLELNIYFKLFFFDVIMNYFPETYLF